MLFEQVLTWIIIFATYATPDFLKNARFFGTLYYYCIKIASNYLRTPEAVNYVDNEIKVTSNKYGRSLPGTNNSLKCPLRGSVLQPILYSTPVHRIRREESPVIRKEILDLLKRKDQVMTNKINILAGAWIQFMIHDWFVTTNKTFKKDNHVYNLNGNDHWWSGSQIYGTEDDRRKFNNFSTNENSKLRNGDYLLVDNEYLPLGENGNELVGFYANFWSGLGFLHHLFVMEHNYIVDMLKKNKCEPSRVFDTARLIVTAMIAKIHTIDWTTSIIQDNSRRLSQYFIWHGFKGHLNIKTHIPLIDGLRGSYDERYNFSHTVEFVSVYRMHSLLPDKITIRDHSSGEVINQVALDTLILGKSSEINKTRNGKLDLLYTMGTHKACKLCLHNYPETLRDLNGIDLAEIDLVRDRERGVPMYNELRRTAFLLPYKDFSEMTNSEELIEKLRQAYPEGIDTMDAMIGLLLEPKIPGTIFGETTYCIFVMNTTKRIERDRFLTQCLTPEYYTDFGLSHIDESSMSGVLLRHYPEMAKHIKKDTNAFIPWDTRAKKLYEDVTGTFMDNLFWK